MSDDLSRVTERVRQNRTQRQTDADALRGQQATEATRAPGIVLAGDRVFDSLSGLYGVVVSTTDMSRPALAAASVQLPDDSIVTRRLVDLVLRPAAPMRP